MTPHQPQATPLRLLQIPDSGFPSGEFSVSIGPEGLVHLGMLTDERSIGRAFQVQIEEGLDGIDLISGIGKRGDILTALLMATRTDFLRHHLEAIGSHLLDASPEMSPTDQIIGSHPRRD